MILEFFSPLVLYLFASFSPPSHSVKKSTKENMNEGNKKENKREVSAEVGIPAYQKMK
jgi:hypothetical protein